jgi:DNA polymerase-3 subunit alpha
VKFDFLGLRNLTILDWPLEYVKLLDPRRPRPRDAAASTIRRPTRIFAKGNTSAIFQFESDGMKKLLTRKLRPTASRTSSPLSRCTGRVRWT